MRAVAADEVGDVERPLYVTAAMTGTPQGELLGLRWRTSINSSVHRGKSRHTSSLTFTRA